jgi:DNA repair exonuclease SbcCD ATPase subunit
MSDLDIKKLNNSWKQEKHQLEKEIISLSMVKDQLWSQKEYYKNKTILLEEKHITNIQSQQFVAIGEKVDGSKNGDLYLKSTNNPSFGTKTLLYNLLENIKAFSSSIEKDLTPLLLEKELNLKGQIENSNLLLSDAEKENSVLNHHILDLNNKVNINLENEEFLSQVERELFEARNQIGNLLANEDTHILEVNNLKNINSSLTEIKNSSEQHLNQISQLKTVIHKGAGDFENLQNKYSSILKDNENLKKDKINIELDCVKFRSKISGLEKILEKRDSVHAEKTGLLLESLKEYETTNKTLSDDIKELTTHLSGVQDELYEERGKLEATLYTRKKMEKKLNSTIEDNDNILNALENENGKLHEEMDKLNESLILMEQNIEELELRVENSKIENNEELENKIETTTIEDNTQPIDETIGSVENREEIKNQLSSIREILTNSLKELKHKNSNDSSNLPKKSFKDDDVSTKLLEENSILKEESFLNSSKLTKLQLKIAYMEDEVVDISSKLKTLTEDNTKLASQDSNFKVMVSELQNEKKELEQSLSDVSRDLKQTRQISMGYSQSVVEEKRKSSILQAEFDKLNSQETTPTFQNDDLLLASPEILDSLIIMDDKIDSLEDSILLEGDRQNIVKSNISDLGSKIFETFEDIETDLIEKEMEIINLRSSLRELDGSSTIHDITSFENEILELREAIINRESTINDLNTQLGKIETELLFGQVTTMNIESISLELDNIANGLEMTGLMKAADDIRGVISKVKG